MEHGPIWPASITHGLGRRPVLLFRHDSHPTVHWYHKLRLRRNRLRFYLPAVPWLRIPPGALVSQSINS